MTAGARVSASSSGSGAAPSTRSWTSRRSFRLNRRPRIAATARSAFVGSGSFVARREISVFTAEGTSRSALPASVQTPSISWIIPPSR